MKIFDYNFQKMPKILIKTPKFRHFLQDALLPLKKKKKITLFGEQKLKFNPFWR